MSYKQLLSILFAVTVVTLFSVPAMATSMVFTDRVTFNAAVGSHALLTLDAPDPVPTSQLVSQVNNGYFNATYSDLFTVTYDSAAFNPSRPGGAPSGQVVFGAGGGFTTIGKIGQPATAFGFDIVHTVSSPSFLVLNGTAYQLNGLSFLGWLSDTPSTFEMYNTSHGTPAVFVIDNVAIKTVPEPSTAIFLVLSVLMVVCLTRLTQKCAHPRVGREGLGVVL